MKISIIMAVYNAEKYLEQAVLSLLNQTLKDIEIICVNDGSTDGSGEILERIAKQDERLKVIVQDNRGQSVAQNVGLELAQGEYVGFLDADDWFEADALEKLYGNSIGADIVFGNICICEGEEKRYDDTYLSLNIFPKDLTVKSFTHQDCSDYIFRIPVTSWCKIYRREFLNSLNIRFVENLVYEDNVFFLETFLGAKSIRLVRDAYYNYRIYSSGTLAQNDRNKLDLFRMLDIEEQIISKYPFYLSQFEFHKKALLFNWFNRIKDVRIKILYYFRLLRCYPMMIFSFVLKPVKEMLLLSRIKKNDVVLLDNFTRNFLSRSLKFVALEDCDEYLKNPKIYQLKELPKSAKIYTITKSYYNYSKIIENKLKDLGYNNPVEDVVLPWF